MKNVNQFSSLEALNRSLKKLALAFGHANEAMLDWSFQAEISARSDAAVRAEELKDAALHRASVKHLR